MTRIPLRLGRLEASGMAIQRSGVRWLGDDGRRCRPGDVVAYCSISLTRLAKQANDRDPLAFQSEMRDFQIAFATRVGGHFHRAPRASRGGFLDQLPHFEAWDGATAIGEIEAEAGEAIEGDPGEARLMICAGRRATEIAEDRSGLLTGWHDRERACWGEDSSPMGGLLSLGICEQSGVFKGEGGAFSELFEAVRGPAQVIIVPDPALVPASRIIWERLDRTSEQMDAIARDMAMGLASRSSATSGPEWIFAGALINALSQSPTTDRLPVLTRAGLSIAGPPDAIVLSLNAEPRMLMRHRTLGYTLHIHLFRLHSAGPVMVDWVRRTFEPVRVSHEDIKRDLAAMADRLRQTSPRLRILVMNSVSSNGDEDIHSYTAFDKPLGDTLDGIDTQERNLVLQDVARDHDLLIVDTDAIAAELGGQRSIPDGLHQNGIMQAEIRAEVLRILRAEGVPGFSPVGRATVKM